jgi:protoheme IX farnesyltransferase
MGKEGAAFDPVTANEGGLAVERLWPHLESLSGEKENSNTEVSVKPTTWKDYFHITKIGITLSNLLSTLTGISLASREGWQTGTTVLTLVSTALVIASGCTLNNYIDRDIDSRMARTQKRALPDGRMQPQRVLWIGITLGVLGISLLGLFVNLLSAMLGLLGLFVYVWIYTAWLKRTSTLSTVIGGISGAIPPVMGYSAVSGTLDLTAWILFIFMFLWQPPHFLALAMRRIEEYRAAGIPLLPVVRGFTETKQQMLRYTTAMVLTSFLIFEVHAAGRGYLTVAIGMGILYMAFCIAGFFTKDNIVWAQKMFRYSLLYLIAMFIGMIMSR